LAECEVKSLRSVSPNQPNQKTKTGDEERYGFDTAGHCLAIEPEFRNEGNGKFVPPNGSHGRMVNDFVRGIGAFPRGTVAA